MSIRGCPGAMSQKIHKRNFDKIVKLLDFGVKIWYNIYVPKRERQKRKRYIKMNEIKRGQVYYCDMSPVVGSEQGGIRPVVIVQNDVGNHYSPTTIVCPITSVMTKKPLPTHVTLNPLDCGLRAVSVVLAEHSRTIDKRRLKGLVGNVPPTKMKEIDKALRISLGV